MDGSVQDNGGTAQADTVKADTPEAGRPEPRTSRAAQPVSCTVCTILIGEGYQETYPIPLAGGKGYACWRCYESLRRQALKRATADDHPKGAPR